MSPDAILEALEAYNTELSDVLGRFSRTRNGWHIDAQDNYRLRTIVTELLDLLRDHIPGSVQHMDLIASSYNEGVSNMFGSASYACVEEIRAVVQAVITRILRNKGLFDNAAGPVSMDTDLKRLLDELDRIMLRFHAVAQQLRRRREDRPTLDIHDEYDVQDLMHALLRLHFDDVRPEEWVPSYAGSASRTDFLLPQIDTMVEVKKTRPGLSAKAVGDQLIIDIAHYQKHPQCKRLYCFVYDPDGRIANPAGIEADLNNDRHGIEVRVSILPKAT
ncbi:hypothetical protein [Achromobacter xylosoxidans]|uniref:PD-(D/E)XK nuclease domain-containing protein n=1 Tax=Alcaligenes xylosoxydans xylosoxydans TaxID=85698 RepID=UPI001F14731B|nr:hypothetical protein [Achromobacter xylosoxidans]